MVWARTESTTSRSMLRGTAPESVLAERADGFGESLFDVHASGVGLDHVLDRWGAVVTQDGGLVVAEAGDGELPQPGRGSR
jgi:hypothetical protein